MIRRVSLKLAPIPVQRHVMKPSLQLERAFHSLFMNVMSSGINWNRKTEFQDRVDTTVAYVTKSRVFSSSCIKPSPLARWGQPHPNIS